MKRWLIMVAIIAFVSWVGLKLWNTMAPIPLEEVIWEAPCPINSIKATDLDLDGQLDLIVGNSELCLWWHLHLKNGRWRAMPIPIPRGWNVGWRCFKNNVLVRAPDGSLWVLQYLNRSGWHWQKLVAGRIVYNYDLTDLDGDGNANDLIVWIDRYEEVVWWFQLHTNGNAQLQSKLQRAKDYEYMEVRGGKLRVTGEHLRSKFQTHFLRDMDGDGKEERIRWHPYSGSKSIRIKLSKSKNEQAIPVPVDKILTSYRAFGQVADLDGNGQCELILLGRRNKRTILLRGWLSDDSWRWQVIPIQLIDEYPSLWVMQLKRKERIFVAQSYHSYSSGRAACLLDAVWWTPKGWVQRRWHFRGMPAHLWNDKNGWQLAVYRYAWARDYYLWKTAREAVLNLRRHGIKVPKIAGAVYWVEVWRWDEERSNWYHTGDFKIGDYTDHITSCDLNGDGYAELIVEETHSNTFMTIGVRTGYLLKRWRSVHLWLNDPYNWMVLRARDGKRTWIVRIRWNNREVRASTLR